MASAAQVAVPQNGRLSIMSQDAALNAARTHRQEATSPTLKMYWQQVIERLQAGRG